MFPYDIHPILVHIPIAFLSIYALVEIVSIVFFSRKWLDLIWLKIFLLLVGVLGAQGALTTGEIASDLNRGELSRDLVEMHETFASVSTGIFFGILVAYLLVVLSLNIKIKDKINSYLQNRLTVFKKIFAILVSLGEFLSKNKFLFLLASVVGVITVTITGALGGSLVYGKDADPIVSLTLKLLNLY
jgi:uncharacterized membrane protein